MSDLHAEINDRLRAADVALALSIGGTSELDHLRHAVGSLLVAVNALVALSQPAAPAARPPAKQRKRRS